MGGLCNVFYTCLPQEKEVEEEEEDRFFTTLGASSWTGKH